MNFFEQELRKLFEKNNGFDHVNFIGNVAYGSLSDKTRMKLEFVTLGTYQKYEGIKATVLDKTDGAIDTIVLKFQDIWGKRKLNNPNFPEGIVPHVWIYNGITEWYAYTPTMSDYKLFAETVKEYAELFKEQTQEMQSSYSMKHQM